MSTALKGGHKSPTPLFVARLLRLLRHKPNEAERLEVEALLDELAYELEAATARRGTKAAGHE